MQNKDLTGCNFTNANLTNTNFSNSILRNTIFNDATINNTIFTRSIDFEFAIFNTNVHNSVIVLGDYQKKTMPSNLTFTPSNLFNENFTGTLNIPQNLLGKFVVHNVNILDIEPGKIRFIDFSITNTRTDSTYLPENLSITITNAGTKGQLNKTNYDYGESIHYTANNDATGTDIIIWDVLDLSNNSLGQGTINMTFTPLPTEAIIDDAVYNVKINTSLEFILVGREVDYFEVMTKPSHGSLRFQNNKNIIPKKLQILDDDILKYVPSLTTAGTDSLTYRAFSVGGVYTSIKTITINIIDDDLSPQKQAIEEIVTSSEILDNIATSIETNTTPVIDLGDDYLDTVGTDPQERKVALKQLIKNIFTTYPEIKFGRMSRDQLGLPSFMLAFAKSFIRVVPPNPTGDLYTLPTLSEESFYCNMEEGALLRVNLLDQSSNNIGFTFEKTAAGVLVTPPINNKSLWSEGEVTSYYGQRVMFGSTLIGENQVPQIFPPGHPNPTITENMTLSIDTGTNINYTFTATDADTGYNYFFINIKTKLVKFFCKYLK